MTQHIYEIYTKNPDTGETGWTIKWVRATKEGIKTFPHFDCIITIDDYPMQGILERLINWK